MAYFQSLGKAELIACRLLPEVKETNWVVPLSRWLVLGGVHSGPGPDAGGADKRPDYVGGREGVYWVVELLSSHPFSGVAESHIWKFLFFCHLTN